MCIKVGDVFFLFCREGKTEGRGGVEEKAYFYILKGTRENVAAASSLTARETSLLSR